GAVAKHRLGNQFLQPLGGGDIDQRRHTIVAYDRQLAIGQPLPLLAADRQAADATLDLVAVRRLVLRRCFDLDAVVIDDLYSLALDFALLAFGIRCLCPLAVGGPFRCLGGVDFARQLLLGRGLRLALLARSLGAPRLVLTSLLGLFGFGYTGFE